MFNLLDIKNAKLQKKQAIIVTLTIIMDREDQFVNSKTDFDIEDDDEEEERATGEPIGSRPASRAMNFHEPVAQP